MFAPAHAESTSKHFNLVFGKNTNRVQAHARWFDHAWVKGANEALKDDMDPVPEDSGGVPGGTDRVGKEAGLPIRDRDSGAKIKPGSAPVGERGGTQTGIARVEVPNPPDGLSVAHAESTIFFFPWVPNGQGGNISGTLTTKEQMSALPGRERHTLYSFAWAGAQVSWTVEDPDEEGKGKVEETKSAQANSHDGVLHYGVWVGKANDRGRSEEAFLLEYASAEWDFGSVDWSNGMFSISAANWTFEYDVPGEYTAEQGRLSIEVVDGIVARSQDSGMYDGLLPGVGTPAYNLDLNLPDHTLNFDLSRVLAAGDMMAIHIETSIGGTDVVPEPATLLGIGIGLSALVRRRRR